MSAAFGFVNVLPSLEALPSSLHHEADSQCVKHIRNTGLYPIQFKNSIITTKILNIHCHIKKQFCSTEVRFFGWNKIFYILQTCSDFRFAIYAMHPWRAIDLNCTSQNVKFRVSLFSIQKFLEKGVKPEDWSQRGVNEKILSSSLSEDKALSR